MRKLAALLLLPLALVAVSPATAVTVPGAVPGSFGVGESGAASFSVPIAVPPGTAGMEPKLSLNYSGQSGNGIAGFGWSLGGLSAVTRCPQTIVQDGNAGGVNYDANDRFCLDGQRLILIAGASYGAIGAEYRTEIESFSKVVSVGGTAGDPQSFLVKTKAGQIIELGNTTNARVEAQGRTVAAAWAINKISDTVGNYIAFTYFEDNANGEHRITRIDYTGNAVAGVAPYNAVEFQYEARPDTSMGYLAGSLMRATQRLTNIQTRASGALVMDYRLAYETGTTTGRSRLVNLTQCVADGSCLMPTVFAWQEGQVASFGATVETVVPTGTTSNTWFAMGDLNADGKTDALFLSSAGVFSPYLSSSFGSFNLGVTTALSSGSQLPSYQRMSLVDSNGDGYAEPMLCGISSYTPAADAYDWSAIYWKNNNGQIDNQTQSRFISSESGITFNASMSQWCLNGDVNADGRTDLIPYLSNYWGYLTILPSVGDAAYLTSMTYAQQFNPRTVSYLSFFDGADMSGDGRTDTVRYDPSTGLLRVWLASGTNAAPVFSAPVSTTIDTGGSPSDRWFSVADVNGDGLADIVMHTPADGKLKVWLSKGDGTVTAKVETLGFDTGGTPADTWFEMVDVNGDGLTDAVKYNPTTGSIKIALSKGDGGFAPSQSLSSLGAGIAPTLGIGPSPTTSWFQPADVNGDGIPDWVRYDPAAGKIKVNLGTGAVPDRLVSITNGFNATTGITYKPLTDPSVYTKGSGSVYPVQDMQAAMYVVSETAADDGAGGTYRMAYRYAGARTHLQGRGFLGFAALEQTDLQTGIVTHTDYSQTFPTIGMPLLATKTTAGGVELSRAANTPANKLLNGGKTNFPYVAYSKEQGKDLNGTVLPSAETWSTFDDSGNATQIITLSSDGYRKQTDNTYTNDTANWLLGRLTRASVTSTLPDATSAVRVSAFEYNAANGLLTKEIIEPDLANVQFRLDTAYTLDAFGNRTITTVSSPATGDAAIVTRATTTAYDAQGRFATSTTNALGHIETRTYDPGLGVLKTLTGPNNLTTTWQYDGFGRKKVETRADTTHTDTTYETCDVNAPGYCAYAVRIKELGSPERITYLDKLGRDTRSAVVGFDGTWVYKDTKYDYAGRVSQVSRPYFSYETPVWATSTYDELGRITSLIEPNTALTQSSYNGLSGTVTDANNHATTKLKNSQGQLVSVTDAKAGLTTYTYDHFGNLIKTIALGVTTQMAYDRRGRKISMDDPDMGHWDYTVNALGELVKQKDAKLQIVTMSYDKLGRMTLKSEPDLISNWYYDTQDGTPTGAACGLSKGKLCKVSSSNLTSRTITYDAVGRPSSGVTTIDVSYLSSTTYDTFGRIDTAYTVNPTGTRGATIKRSYNAQGYLKTLTRVADNKVLWTAKVRDAEGQLYSATLGNGFTQYRAYYADSGRVYALNDWSSTGTHILSTAYVYDPIGNIKTRTDSSSGLAEKYTYDELDRLTSYTKGTNATQNYVYDAKGNLTTKGINTLSYGAACPGSGAGPHAVCSTAMQGAYTYDANGNQTNGAAGRAINWTSYNQPFIINDGGTLTLFLHDADHQRIKQTRPDGSYDIYINPLMGVGLPLEKAYTPAGADPAANPYVTQFKTALITPDGQIGQSVDNVVGGLIKTTLTRYFHKDLQGSIMAVTDDTAAVVAQYSYGPWGARVPLIADTLNNRRGYTGHEHLDDGLIHMNGRIYDPVISRFLQADPYIQAPDNGQSYNRYSYVMNNPLGYTDPSGYFSLSEAWRDIRGAVKTFVGIYLTAIGNPVGPALIQSGFNDFNKKPSLSGVSVGVPIYQSRFDAGGQQTSSCFGPSCGGGISFSGPSAAAERKAQLNYGFSPTLDRIWGNTSSSSYQRGRVMLSEVGEIGVGRYLTRDPDALEAVNWEAYILPFAAPARVATGAASGTLPSVGGVVRQFEQAGDKIYYRVFSGNASEGRWLTAVPPRSSAWAQDALALPPGNKATTIQEVLVQDGTLLERSRAIPVPEWGRMRGGAEQFKLIDRIPDGNYGPGKPLP
jgi:RHS repeat-associated protein